VERVRVLFLNDTARNGGPGRTLYTTLKYLDPSRIHRAVVVPRPGPVSELIAQGHVCEEFDLEPLVVENPIAPWTREMVRADFDAAAWLKATRAVGNVGLGAAGILRLAARARRYDVVFCNGTTANFIGGALARLFRMRVVWHVFYTDVAPALVPLHRFLASSAGVGAILCVSKPTTAQFAGLGSKVACLHDAIDTEEYAPGTPGVLRAELGLGPDVTIFGSQGRILRRKGYVELVEAARIVFDRLDTAERERCRFVVLGDTPEDMPVDHLAECRALVAARGLEGRVHFLGYRPDVRPYVADFDVAMVPSVYPDPLPRSVMESMAMEKPVVAFDVGGIGEMVTDGETGTLCAGSPPDVEGLAKACLAYVRDPAMRARHGRAARARIERDYGAKAHSREIEEVLVRVARGDGNGR
jgi:glycosyltransferase involved in cell wall biosynthesis